jgi:hypothetical protein
VLLASYPALSLHEMDINKMLAELRREREQVEEAIIVLSGLHSAGAEGEVGHLLG